MPDQHSAKWSNEQPKKGGEKDEQDQAIQRVLRDLYGRPRPRPQMGGHGGLKTILRQQSPYHGHEEGRGQEEPRGAFGQEVEGGRRYGPQPRPYQGGPRERFGPTGGYPRMGLKSRVSYRGDSRLGARTTPLAPDVEFPWLTVGEVDALAIRLAEKLIIQP